MKIGADELSPVTQLFTEDYIVPYQALIKSLLQQALEREARLR